MKASILQRMIQRNRYAITDLEEAVSNFKQFKHEADIKGDTELEYYYHEELKYYRKYLADMVAEQKALKKLIKE